MTSRGPVRGPRVPLHIPYPVFISCSPHSRPQCRVGSRLSPRACDHPPPRTVESPRRVAWYQAHAAKRCQKMPKDAKRCHTPPVPQSLTCALLPALWTIIVNGVSSPRHQGSDIGSNWRNERGARAGLCAPKPFSMVRSLRGPVRK